MTQDPGNGEIIIDSAAAKGNIGPRFSARGSSEIISMSSYVVLAVL